MRRMESSLARDAGAAGGGADRDCPRGGLIAAA